MTRHLAKFIKSFLHFWDGPQVRPSPAVKAKTEEKREMEEETVTRN